MSFCSEHMWFSDVMGSYEHHNLPTCSIQSKEFLECWATISFSIRNSHYWLLLLLLLLLLLGIWQTFKVSPILNFFQTTVTNQACIHGEIKRFHSGKLSAIQFRRLYSQFYKKFEGNKQKNILFGIVSYGYASSFLTPKEGTGLTVSMFSDPFQTSSYNQCRLSFLQGTLTVRFLFTLLHTYKIVLHQIYCFVNLKFKFKVCFSWNIFSLKSKITLHTAIFLIFHLIALHSCMYFTVKIIIHTNNIFLSKFYSTCMLQSTTSQLIWAMYVPVPFNY
jgi:hypothetical protein